jgi:hypothetical protein
MSPTNRSNPDLTSSAGAFGWDVTAGHYQVTASAPGCVSPTNPLEPFVTTGVLTVPPAVTDLVLTLKCPGAKQPPVASEFSITTPEDHAIGVALSASDADADPLTFTVTSGPSHGTLSGTAPNLTYTPSANFFGTDSVTYIANDGHADSAPATVTITVTPVNDAPTAAPTATQPQVEGTAIALASNATDVEGNPLTFSWVATPTLDAGGACTFSAPTAATTDLTCTDDGPVSVTLTVSDGVASTTSSVQLQVLNVAPTLTVQPIAVAGPAPALVTVTSSIADAGANDVLGCTVDFGDSVPRVGTVVGGTCSSTVSVTLAGTFTATVTVTDDDGGSTTKSSDYTVAAPPAPRTALGEAQWVSGSERWTVSLDDERAPFDKIADRVEITRPNGVKRQYDVATIDIVGTTATIATKAAKDGSRATLTLVDNGARPDQMTVTVTDVAGRTVASMGGLKVVTKGGFTIGARSIRSSAGSAVANSTHL